MTLLTPSTVSDFALTDDQQRAISCDTPALVATASAGTGKTEVLAHRVERFVASPDNRYSRVLVVTYTNRAAEEFRSRLRVRVGASMERILARTIHGFARWVLNAYGTHVGLSPRFQVVTTDEDRAELLSEYRGEMSPDDYRTYFRTLDLARAQCTDHPGLAEWSDALNRWDSVDFGEMIIKATEVLNIPAIAEMMRVVFGLVVVDEAQNLTEQQYQLLTTLIGNHLENRTPLIPTTLLGDPSQCVTGFAGGDNKIMARFATDYDATEVELTQNFRSAYRLALLERDLACELRRGNSSPNVLTGTSARGVIECHRFRSEQEEGAFVANWVGGILDEGLPLESVAPGEEKLVRAEDIAVLARHSATLHAATEALRKQGYEVARAHSEVDLMATGAGSVALALMRLRSARHELAAWATLRRELRLQGSAAPFGDRAAGMKALSKALSAHSDRWLDTLRPLLDADRARTFVATLEFCQPPRVAPEDVLAAWHADRQLILSTWSEFANVTPIAEQSWSNFAGHFDSVFRARDLGPGIRLLTVHKAQGREFKAVAVVGMNEGQFPDFRARTDDQQEAELQAFYVAATRASRVLLLTRARERPTRYGTYRTEPSQYLGFVEKALANE